MSDEAQKEAQAAFASATGGSAAPAGPPAPGAPPPVAPVPTLSKEEMADAAVSFMSFWTPTTVGILGFAMGRDVPPGVGSLSKDEENMMRMCGAGAAYPLLEKMINKSETIGAIIFLGSWSAICYKKVSSCPKKKKLVKDGTGTAEPAGDDKPTADGPTPVGQPFKCPKGLAAKLGCKPGARLQKLSDGNYQAK